MSSLQGRLAVVTGAGRGIGRAIAEAMAAAGAAVMLADVDAEEAARGAEGIKALGGHAWSRRLDVSDAAACRALADELAGRPVPVSILINNAGVIFPGTIDEDRAPEGWTRTLDINLGGAFNMARAFHGQLTATRGAVVNLASIRSFVAAGNAAAYAASKGAIMQFTKALAVEWGPHGVRVNAIAPGFIETGLVPADQKTQAREDAILQRTPLGRIGEPADIGGAAVFLASDAARYVSGVILPVDGGYLAA
jgi:meso-butanediol dehydrogenase/(S,S)-butanediol dehydrogenase/diacetyl reductase